MNTYLIKSGYFDHDMIRDLFRERGGWTTYDEKVDKYLTFLYLDGDAIYKDKSHYEMKAEVKNLMDASSYKIGDKSKLYTALEKYNPEICDKYMMKQYHVSKETIDNEEFKTLFKSHYILKPIVGHKGMGIQIFNSYNRFYFYVTNYLKTKQNKTAKTGWVLAKYIDNPLLYKGKKFHFRVFYLVYYDEDSKRLRGYVLKKMYLVTALKPFVLADFNNKDIHDTHFSEQGSFYFPDDTYDVFDEKAVDLIYGKIYTMFYHILQISDGKCYIENKRCYHIFGADVMVTTDMDVKLLEINDWIGHCSLDKCKEFNKYYMQSQLEVVIDRWFPPKNKIDQVNGFMEITQYVNYSGGNYYKKYKKYKQKYLKLKGGQSLEDVVKSSRWLTNSDSAKISYNDLVKFQGDLSKLSTMFKEYHVEFPYKYRYKTKEQVINSFNNLKKYEQQWSTKPYRVNETFDMKLRLPITFSLPTRSEKPVFMSMGEQRDTYTDIDWITDYFIEDSRMKCMRARKKLSPHDAWYSYGDYLKNAVSLLINRRMDMTVENLREALYKDRTVTEECTHEKPSFTKMLFKKLEITEKSKIFDAAAGWGDRMIASMSLGAKYLGVDPNENSQLGFKKMKEILGPMSSIDKDNYDILPLAMPDCVLPDWANNFDLVFLSPPSFDSEVYSDDKGQSVIMYPNKTDWFINFMFKTVDRCWELLSVDGYFVIQSIIINEIAPYIFAYCKNSYYCGVISIQFPSRYKPMWIWKKMDNNYKFDDNSMRLNNLAKDIIKLQYGTIFP